MAYAWMLLIIGTWKLKILIWCVLLPDIYLYELMSTHLKLLKSIWTYCRLSWTWTTLIRPYWNICSFQKLIFSEMKKTLMLFSQFKYFCAAEFALVPKPIFFGINISSLLWSYSFWGLSSFFLHHHNFFLNHVHNAQFVGPSLFQAIFCLKNCFLAAICKIMWTPKALWNQLLLPIDVLLKYGTKNHVNTLWRAG